MSVVTACYKSCVIVTRPDPPKQPKNWTRPDPSLCTFAGTDCYQDHYYARRVATFITSEEDGGGAWKRKESGLMVVDRFASHLFEVLPPAADIRCPSP